MFVFVFVVVCFCRRMTSASFRRSRRQARPSSTKTQVRDSSPIQNRLSVSLSANADVTTTLCPNRELLFVDCRKHTMPEQVQLLDMVKVVVIAHNL